MDNYRKEKHQVSKKGQRSLDFGKHNGNNKRKLRLVFLYVLLSSLGLCVISKAD